MKPKILFIMHMPPPVHGAAMMGQYIHDSKVINDAFDCYYINPSLSKEVANVGKINLRKIACLFSNLFSIARTVLKEKPDLCYFTSTIGGWGIFRDMLTVGLLKLLRQRIILHLHNKGARNFYAKHKIAGLAYRTIFRNTKVILLAEELYEDISLFARKKNIYYCPNGIPVTLDKPIERLQPHTPYRFLFLSNMIESKGVVVLLKACRILKEKGYKFICNFVGKWSDITEKDFNGYVAELGISDCVCANGPKYGKEKEAFLAGSDALAFPTYYENEAFPLVLLEGMEFGLPCISTYEGGIPSIIEDNENGVLVKQRDAHQLAEAMMQLIERPSEGIRMGENGRKRFLERYTLECFENRMAGILKDCIIKN